MTIDIERLKQLCSQATPGPWTADVWIETDGNGWRATGPHHEDHDCWTEPGCPDEQAAQRDAAFIVAAREAVPALVAEVERLTDAKLFGEKMCAQLVAERDEARAEVERLTEERDGDRSQRSRAVMDVAICQERIAELERELAVERNDREHWARDQRMLDETRAERDALRAQLAAVTAERDEWRAVHKEMTSTVTREVAQEFWAQCVERDTAERIDQWLYDEVKRLGEEWAPTALARKGLADKQEAVADLLTAFRANAWKRGQDV